MTPCIHPGIIAMGTSAPLKKFTIAAFALRRPQLFISQNASRPLMADTENIMKNPAHMLTANSRQ